MIDREDSTVVIVGESLVPVNKVLHIGRPIVVSGQRNSRIVKMAHQLGKIIDPHPDIQKGIEKGPISAPLNTHLLSEELTHFWHNLHQPFCSLYGDSPGFKFAFNGDESQDEFWVMIVTDGLFIDDLCKFLLGHIRQPRGVPLQNSKDLFDRVLPVLDSKIEWGEVKREGENDEKEESLKEKTTGTVILYVSGRMGRVPRPYQRIVELHTYLLVTIFHIVTHESRFCQV